MIQWERFRGILIALSRCNLLTERTFIMRAMPYKKSNSASTGTPTSNSYVSEALAKQAASRPPKSPPKIMPITPTLPRVPKPHKHKRRVV